MPGRTVLEAPAGGVSSFWTPADSGLFACSMNDPGMAQQNQVLTTGRLYVMKVPIPAAHTIASVRFLVNAAVVTPANFNGLGLYVPQGSSMTATLVAQTADQGASGFAGSGGADTIANWQVGGVDTPVTVSPSYVWVGILSNGATGVSLRSAGSTIAGPNFGLVSGATTQQQAARSFLAVGTGLTALPATIALGAAVGNYTQQLLVGLV